MFTIEKLTPDNFDEADELRRQSWRDTYVNEELGITQAWIIARQQAQSDPKKYEERKQRILNNPHGKGLVAKDQDGRIIGLAMPHVDDKGLQHVGALYVDKKWHGKGVGGALMERIIEWADPGKPIVCAVASYNERAIKFYKKWGFEEIGMSDELAAGKIPILDMRRKGDKQ